MNTNMIRAAAICLLLFSHGSVGLRLSAFGQTGGSKTAEPRNIASPGVPGAVVAYGDQARVLAVGRIGESFAPVIVSGQLPGSRSGRIVLFGHDGYLSSEAIESFDTRAFFFEVATSASRGGKSRTRNSKKPIVGLIERDSLAPAFASQGWDVRQLTGDWHKQIANLDLAVLTAYSVSTSQQVQAVDQYLRGGGGILFGITGWGWEQTHSGKTLAADLPIAPILTEAGLAVTNFTIEPADPEGKTMMVIRPDEMPLVHAGKALEKLLEHRRRRARPENDESAQISTSLEMAIHSIGNKETPFRKSLASIAAGQTHRPITEARPVRKTDVLERLAIHFRHDLIESGSMTKVALDPSAADFPGSVSARAPRISREMRFPAGLKGRMGTGLYAPPGASVRLHHASGRAPDGLQVRIGAHSDTLWHLDEWRRNPEITRVRQFRKDAAELHIANPFGGLVYLEVEKPLPEDFRITIDGVVQAPHYVLGTTTKEQWSRLRNSPAPWAELQSRHIGLVLPSESVRSIADPLPLMELWDRIVECQDELGPLGEAYMPTQWIVPDRQISAGYMHSGNPIMTGLDAVPCFASVEKLTDDRASGSVSWGIYHEIGHNRQRSSWTPTGTGEVTNNLFTLYTNEKFTGKPSSGIDALLTGNERAEALKRYRATGPNFEVFQNDPFLALAFFMEIQEAFGWKPFIDYFKACEKLGPNETPGTDEEKWNSWLTGLSKLTGRNLSPHFESWGIPVTSAARESLKTLPAWPAIPKMP